MAARHLPGPYALPAYRVRTSAVATNKPPIVPYRGVARTGICFAIELTIDAVARAVGREACDVRRENLVPATAMPFVTVTGNAYDSGDYRRSLDIARERVNLPAIRARQAKADGDTLIGVGFANYIEMTAHGTALFSAAGYPFTPGHEQAAVRFTPDGGLEIRVGVHSHGQGMETSLAQIAHEVLGIPVAAIAVVLGDTAMTPYSTGTYASRSITMAGGAVARACEILKRRLAAIAAHLLQCTASDVSLRAGIFYGPTGDIPVRDVAATWYLHPQRLPPDTDGMEVTGGFKPKVDSGQYSYGTHAAVVEIDRALGSVRILDYVIVEDCGTMVNPMIVEGQTLGGAAQGIGTALFEEMAFDANGQPQASTLADYMMPGATDMPRITIHHIETPSPHTDYGIKGVGEGGAIPPPAAIFNAVNDALRGLGVEFNETPLTPPKLVLALAEAEARKGGPGDLIALALDPTSLLSRHTIAVIPGARHPRCHSAPPGEPGLFPGSGYGAADVLAHFSAIADRDVATLGGPGMTAEMWREPRYGSGSRVDISSWLTATHASRSPQAADDTDRFRRYELMAVPHCSGVDDRREAAIDHALAVERHVGVVRLHPPVLHDLRPGRVARLLRGPFDPGVDDLLVARGLHRALEVGDLAVGHVVAPRFDHARGAVFLEHRRGLGGHGAVGILVGGRNRHQEAIGIAHLAAGALFDDGRETTEDHALAVERHVHAHLLHARIAHHLLVGRVARRLVGIFEPGEHDDFIRLGLHRALEVGELAVGHVVAPGLDHAGCAELLEHRRGVGGVLAKGFLVRGRNRDDKSFDIAHGFSPRWVGDDWIRAAAKIRAVRSLQARHVVADVSLCLIR